MLTAAVVLALVGVRLWNYRGPRTAQPITGPLAAAALLLLAWAAGLAVSEIGLTPPTTTTILYALGGVLTLAAFYALVLTFPRTRRTATPSPRPWRTALIDIPLATVTFEEVAFRGVLWAAIAADAGPAWATGGTAVLFGLWHLPHQRERPVVVIGTVVFTAAAGFVLAVLCRAGGGLLVPFAVHWAANAFGVLAVAAVHRAQGKPGTGE
ncbi:CPBP family intramembrane glutamic endopeptidase [Actinoplanes solisilvae]|uniref:CPBP family intramembrane glutamic endopeptidase n=1 Tax=Actinoplanes solisilvae TaxID=2486853 RepID=UPI000FD82863|nr:CPBP family intramembrane glutamic endopeptidase [Actinoplanes solisilvae]